MTKTKLRDGEFLGTKRELERRAARAHASIIKHPRYQTLNGLEEVFVDAAGTVYGRNPETQKFTVVVAQCVPKEG